MLLKLLTAPIWGLPWMVAKVLRARAVVRQGRKRIPVRVVPASVRPGVLPAPPVRVAAPAQVTIRVVVRREP